MRDPVFVDTSAFYALMDRSDRWHAAAAALWPGLLDADAGLVTSNYVIVETLALVQNRLGYEAAASFSSDLLGVVETRWVDRALHEVALEIWRGIGRREVSLVDCASFVLMRQAPIRRAFSFDRHFAGQGFELLPA